MPSADRALRSGLKKRVLLALLVALAAALSGLERLIPAPLPWMKIGLANAVTLLALLLFGFREALAVTVGRVLLVALVLGGLMSPTFVLSLGGGLASAAVMGLLLLTGAFSPFGLSVAGSFIHTLTQFGLLSILLVKDASVLRLAPPFLLLSLLTGAFVGWLVAVSRGAILQALGEELPGDGEGE